MRGWLCCIALGALLAGCASTAAVQGARDAFLATTDTGAKEAAPFEYYASKAYLELARQTSEAEDHSQARTWSEQSRQYAAEAVRLAGAEEGAQPLLVAAVTACAGPRPLGEGEAARIDALKVKFDRAVALEARECAPKELAIASALLDYDCYTAALPEAKRRTEFPPAEPTLDGLLAKTEPCWLERHDADGDKVADDLDQCPATPGEAKVDAAGCPLDGDDDGVADYLDQCADTPAGVAVREDGCPPDGDADGVADYQDACADTPVEAKVGEDGCPLDGDGDGVADYLDQCADTPDGVAVQADGCPPDGDGDGVPDYQDACAETPAESKVGEDGCALDGDGDGVADYLDQCADTPEGVAVTEDGCPPDGDGDGVADHRDDCPETSSGVAVGEDGCPQDEDGDGVFDERDACPATPAGTEVDEEGCGLDQQSGAIEPAEGEPSAPAGDGAAPDSAAPASDQ